MWQISGLRDGQGTREIIYQCATQAQVERWKNQVGKYCHSHSFFSVTHTDFDETEYLTIKRATPIRRLIRRLKRRLIS